MPFLAVIAGLLLLPQSGDIAPPANAQAALVAVGHGVQIYKCAASQTQPTTWQWVLQGPEADLFDKDTKQPVGTHTAGPTWTWHDGSAITGKVIAMQPSPDPGSIPWLLLETQSSGTPGALANIKYVRRSDTQAGASPAGGCDAEHQDNTLRVPYEALYTFYTAQ